MRNTALAVMVLAAGFGQAQVTSHNAQVPDGEKTLFERVAKIEKKNDLFNLYLNMHGAFDAKFNQDGRNGLSQGAFNMRQLRIEAKGEINDWLSYRWRQRLNRGNEGGAMIDNLPNSIDFAGIGIKFNDKFSLFAGKQAAAWGGFEYDVNPIEIYQYSEMINNMSNFMTGVTLNYDMTPTQQFQLQVLDSRNGSQDETYGKGLEESRLPLVYSFAWNANMCDMKWQTRWSASVMEETHGKYMYYLALGNQFNFSSKCNMYVDLMSSFEQVDNKGIISRMILGDDYKDNGHGLYNTMYNSLVTKVNYRIMPKWNLFAKGMLESAAIYDGENGIAEGNYRTSLGYIAGVEFYPMDTNLHFYLAFVGQSNFFTEKAKMYGQSNYSTQRLSLGFIYQLPMF
ncbi:MAG: OprO/OprP family phosphate-selective porin [Bacteroidaceae bacterium]|nr:OprO/OprP family phosphate-selective porin [Bacteroidaceae bacterium]